MLYFLNKIVYNKNMSELLKAFREQEKSIKKRVTLKNVSNDYSHFPEDIRKCLDELYQEDNEALLFATLINACFTQKRVCFIVSKALMSNLLFKDSNNSRNTVNSTLWKQFNLFILKDQKFFKFITPKTKGMPGVLEATNVVLTSLLKCIIDDQRNESMEVWNDLLEKNKKSGRSE